jgi:hypothetical protein
MRGTFYHAADGRGTNFARNVRLKVARSRVDNASMKRVGAIVLLILVAAGAGAGGAYVLLSRGAMSTVVETRTTVRERPTPKRPQLKAGGAPTCLLTKHGADVAVWVHASNAQAFCRSWVRDNSGDGAYWEMTPGGDPPMTDAVCVLTSGGGTLQVHDTGGAIEGGTICGNLVHAGWGDAYNGD